MHRGWRRQCGAAPAAVRDCTRQQQARARKDKGLSSALIRTKLINITRCAHVSATANSEGFAQIGRQDTEGLQKTPRPDARHRRVPQSAEFRRAFGTVARPSFKHVFEADRGHPWHVEGGKRVGCRHCQSCMAGYGAAAFSHRMSRRVVTARRGADVVATGLDQRVAGGRIHSIIRQMLKVRGYDVSL